MLVVKNNIKLYREKLGLSQYELAKKVGLTRRGILYIENHSKNIRMDNAFKIAGALGADISEVFYVEEEGENSEEEEHDS